MAATNSKTKRSHVYSEERLAGGYGPHAAKQSDEMALRRLVLTCLLWEDNAYVDGKTVVEQIKELCHKVPAYVLERLAIEARYEQKLRHIPLLLCRELARHKEPDWWMAQTHNAAHARIGTAETLAKVINRPDEIAEFLSLYWRDNYDKEGKKTKVLAKQVKLGLAKAFEKFDEYSFGKWDKDGKEIKLRDVLMLVHGKTKDTDQMIGAMTPSVEKKNYKRGKVWRHKGSLADKIMNGSLATPDTWEVGLSAAKTPEDKKAVWERLISEKKLGVFAFLKNLRNMNQVGVDRRTIEVGLTNSKPTMALPIDFLRAAVAAPDYLRSIESLMLKCAAEWPKLPGWTILVVDVSGSMSSTKLSEKSDFSRMDAAASMAVLAAEMCESLSVYATAGSDHSRHHQTAKIPAFRGFGMSNAILKQASRLGGGGIFTRQCLEYIREREKGIPDRIIVFSDSQDCDYEHSKIPNPFGKRNYIVDVSPHKNGINYHGLWTAEISGWSEAFLKYIAFMESSNLQVA